MQVKLTIKIVHMYITFSSLEVIFVKFQIYTYVIKLFINLLDILVTYLNLWCYNWH